MSKKTVFLIGTRWFGVLGPCQFIIRDLVEKGYDVFVIGASDNKYQQFETNGAKLVEVNFKRSYFSFFSDIKDLIKLIQLARKYKPEHIHSFNPKPSFFAMALNFLFGGRLYIGITGLGNTFIKNGVVTNLFKKLIKLTYNRADYLFFQNKDDVEYFKKYVIKDVSKIKSFTSPGVDIKRFKPRDKKIKNQEKIKVLFVGRLLWQKGVDDFLAAEKEFKKSYPDKNVSFTLIGPADYEHPDRLSQKEIDEIVESDITWIEWVEDIENYYQSHDLLVFMSHREGGPRAILEASACCMPTIGANTIGVRDLVISGQTGYLVELHDVENIAKKIAYYYDNQSIMKEHGLNARKLIAEPLSLDNATKAQLKMYEE